MRKKIVGLVILVMLSGMVTAQIAVSSGYNGKVMNKWIVLPDGIKLNYVEKGNPSGKVVIFLHGYTDSWHSFEETLQYMPTAIRALVPSLRGHGDSDRPDLGYAPADFAKDIALFCRQLQIKSAVIVGHSMGSVVAQRFALDYPEMTEGLVLISGFGNMKTNTGIRELFDLVNQQDEKSIPQFSLEFQKSTIEKPMDSAYFSLLVNESIKVPLFVWKRAIEELTKVNYLEELRELDKPTLILWGDKDNICFEDDQQLLRASIRNSQFIRYKKTPHAIHWEQPEKVAKDILAFISSLSVKK